MAQKFPIDEFDAVELHGGRHRERRTAKHRLIEWVRIFVAAAVVAGAGYGVLKIVDNATMYTGDISFGTASQAPAITDPGVNVLDGKVGDLGAKVGEALRTAGFNVLTAINLVDSNDNLIKVKATTIFITDEAFNAEASDLAKAIGDYPIVVSTKYAGPITLVLGEDFVLNGN
jgi:hypothetical protein